MTINESFKIEKIKGGIRFLLFNTISCSAYIKRIIKPTEEEVETFQGQVDVGDNIIRIDIKKAKSEVFLKHSLQTLQQFLVYMYKNKQEDLLYIKFKLVHACANKNKDHFLLRAKKDLVKITHTIKSDSIHYINNCYASSENPNYTHALSIKSIDFENDYTSVVTTRSLNDDFQVMPKKVFAHIYKDYMKLVDLYGETISNNKRKKLRTLYDTINRINSSNINTVNNFYKTKFNSKALVMFYENFYKEEVPKIKSRLENSYNLT
jgi:hypothetical protein